MRRPDREIKDKKEIESIIRESKVCRIALIENNSPYIVPLCFGYENNCLYFHSARNGKKIDMIKKNDNVCFEFDIEDGFRKSQIPCKSSMKYRSVIGYGRAFLIDDINEKIHALDIIMEQYSNLNDTFEYQTDSIDNILIIKIEIKNITGKKT